MTLSPRRLAELRLRRALSSSPQRRRRRGKVPVARWPRSARTEYFLALKEVLGQLRERVEQVLLPQLPQLLRLVEVDKPTVHLDAADDLKKELDKIAGVVDDAASPARVRELARKAGQQVAAFNKRELNRQFSSALGIDLLQGEPWLQQQLELFVEDNARLISSLASEHLEEVTRIVLRGARAGTTVKQLRKEIEARFDVAESKAELIARDQVGKLNGELTQLRQASVGVTEYEWSTSRDERVRSRHQELEGTIHRWDEPPIVDYKTGRRAHPGQDFQCRCTALPRVDDLLEALGREDLGGPPVREPTPSRPPPVRVPEPAE